MLRDGTGSASMGYHAVHAACADGDDQELRRCIEGLDVDRDGLFDRHDPKKMDGDALEHRLVGAVVADAEHARVRAALGPPRLPRLEKECELA